MQWRLALPQASLFVHLPSGLARAKSSVARVGAPSSAFTPSLSLWHVKEGCKVEAGCVGSGTESVAGSTAATDSEGKFSKLAKRVSYGALMGGLGLLVIMSGGVLYTCFAAAAAYQTTNEFIELVASMGSRNTGMAPPSSISALMSVFCVFFPLMAYFYPTGGKPAVMLTLAAFLLLSMEVLTVEKPKFSQLTAAVFGLFYCGECADNLLLFPGKPSMACARLVWYEPVELCQYRMPNFWDVITKIFGGYIFRSVKVPKGFQLSQQLILCKHRLPNIVLGQTQNACCTRIVNTSSPELAGMQHTPHLYPMLSTLVSHLLLAHFRRAHVCVSHSL